MNKQTFQQFLLIVATVGLVSCGGGGDAETVEPAAPDASAAASSEGGGNGGGGGGANGGAAGNGGGEGSGNFNIVFADDAVCGVDFISTDSPQLDRPVDQRMIEIFGPCGPQGGDSFTTNDGAINNQSLECDAGVRARYQAEFPVVNTDCD